MMHTKIPKVEGDYLLVPGFYLSLICSYHGRKETLNFIKPTIHTRSAMILCSIGILVSIKQPERLTIKALKYKKFTLGGFYILSPAGAVGPGTGDIATPPVRLSVCPSVCLSGRTNEV